MANDPIARALALKNTSEIGSLVASGGSSYGETFAQSDIVDGKITITHGLATKNIAVAVYNDDDEQILPDLVTIMSANAVELDLSSFTATTSFSVAVVGGSSVSESSSDAVLYTVQELTDSQKEQARTNIDAVSSDELTASSDNALSDAKSYVDGKNYITNSVDNLTNYQTTTVATATYLGINATAVDSDKLGGKEWVFTTQAAYEALSDDEKEDPTKVYLYPEEE